MFNVYTMFFFFPTDIYYYILVIPAMLFAGIASMMVSTTFNKYQNVGNSRGLTGRDVARQILDSNGLHNVQVEQVSGNLTDHYDPTARVVRLSTSVYGSQSVGAIGVAAHEVGHAIQHATEYAPIKIRTAIIPITNIGSTISIPLIMIGFFIGVEPLINIGIILFSAVAVFQLVTLPVEFDASARAIKTLDQQMLLQGSELDGAKKVLTAAALTYVAALIQSLAQILRLVLLTRRNND